MMPLRHRLAGSIAAVATMGLLVAVMLPLRAHLAIAVVALVLAVPVVVAVVMGGSSSGVLAVALGFLVYDLLFIPPYGTLPVGRAENWVPLGVYVIVMLLTSRVVDRLWRAEAASRESEHDTARLFDLSELLVADRPLEELTDIVVRDVREAFGLSAVALLMPEPSPAAAGGAVRVVARSGRLLDEEELRLVLPAGGSPSSLRAVSRRSDGSDGEPLETVVLTIGDRPVGLLAIAGRPLGRRRRELLSAFANHIALAIERTMLRAQAVRVGILEEVDRQRRTLLGAVSHDLRTPLATIKASATALLDSSLPLGTEERAELTALIETQSDRLERVVANLLDLSRIQAGALVAEIEPLTLGELLAGSLEALGPTSSTVELRTAAFSSSTVSVDRVLVVEALVNVLENAVRYSPPRAKVVVSACPLRGRRRMRLVIADEGPGIRPEDRGRVFDLFEQGSGPGLQPSGGTGLGLSIARAFLEAQGGSISVDEQAVAGTRMVVELEEPPERPLLDESARGRP